MAYRKINPLLWDDEWFVGLTDFDRIVWFAILTGPQVRQIPGLMIATAATIADYLRRDAADVAGVLVRFAAEGRVELDARARMLRVVNAPRWAAEHGEPENPNVIKGWWKAWKELPTCDLKRRHAKALREAFIIARDRAAAGERDQGKAHARLESWDATWTITFGTVSPETVSGPPAPALETVTHTVPGAPTPPPGNGIGNPPAYARARSEQEQEQEPEQEPESSRVPARPPAPARETLPLDNRAALVHGWLRESSDLAAMADAGTLDLARCARDILAAGDGFVMGGRLREEEAAERLQAAAADLAREVAAAASTSQPMPPREVARKARTFANTALAKSREEWARRGRPSGGPVSSDAREVLAVFGEVWSARKKAPFVQSAGDEKHAGIIAETAREHADQLKIRPRDVVRHWAEQHLRSPDKFVVDSGNALRTMPMQLTAYGLPKPPREKPPTPPPAEPLAGAPMPPGMLDAIGAQGPREGAMMRRPGGPS